MNEAAPVKKKLPTWAIILIVVLAVICVIAVLVPTVLALLGPAIGNTFNGIQNSIQ